MGQIGYIKARQLVVPNPRTLICERNFAKEDTLTFIRVNLYITVVKEKFTFSLNCCRL